MAFTLAGKMGRGKNLNTNSRIPLERWKMEEIRKKVLTSKMLVIGIVCAFLWTFFSLWNVAIWTMFPAREWNWGVTWNGMFSGAFLLIIIWGLLQYLIPEKYRLNSQEMSLLFAFGAGAIMAAAFRAPGAYIAHTWGWRYREPFKTTWGPWLPEAGVWSPSEEVSKLMLTGGVPVPAEWYAPLAFWMTFALAGIFEVLGLVLLMRRRWIEIEGVTFPYGNFASEIARIVEPYETKSARAMKPRVKMVFIGLLVGFLFYTPYLLSALFPWFPSLYGWETWPFVPWHPGALDLNRAIPAINTILPGSWAISLYPLFWSLSILAPVSVSLSTGLTWLVLMGIAPALLYFAGTYPVEITTLADSHAVAYFIAKTAPLKLGPFGVIGAGLALAVLPFIFDWKYWSNHFKATIGARPLTSEEKASEPWHPRWSLLMLVGGFILQIVMSAAVGANALYSIIGLITLTLIGSITVARGSGEMGWFPEYSDYHGALTYNIAFPNVTMDNMTTEYVSTMLLWGGRSGGHILGMAAHNVQPVGAFNSFRMGHLLNVPARDTIISYMIGALISVLFGWPLFLWMNYNYGLLNLPGLNTAYNWGSGYISTIDPTRERAFFELPILEWIVAGFVVVGFLMFMSRRFVWWPLAPIGVFLGLSVTGWAMGAASTGLGGYVVKQAILKTLGVRFYEEKVVPFLSGLTGGLVLTCVLMYGVAAIRLFAPGIL